MRVDCQVIEDILPLYVDHLCSRPTEELVNEHLARCEKCRKIKYEMENPTLLPVENRCSTAEDAVKAGFQKIRKRWMASVLAVLMLLPLVGVGTLAYHETQGEGTAFSNLDDIFRCIKFLRHIENGEFELASEMVDFTDEEYFLLEGAADMAPEEYQQYMKVRFVDKLREYEALGLSIDNVRYDTAYRGNERETWSVCVSFEECYPDGTRQRLVADMNGETLVAGAWHYPGKGETARDDYIDEILCLYFQEDPLGYQEFPVAFELKRGEKAVIRRLGRDGEEVDGVFNLTYGTGSSLIDEPYVQNTFETSVPGQYAVGSYLQDGTMRFLTGDELLIEITAYSPEN